MLMQTSRRSNPIRAQRDSELLRQAEPQDLLKYGLIPEFVGQQ